MQAMVAPAGTTTLAIGGGSEQMLAQTFTVVREGTLTGVALPLGCASGTLEIEIRALVGEEPGTDVLAAQSFPAADFVTPVTVFKVFALPGTAVAAGDRLTLVLRNPSGSCGVTRGADGDLYPDGSSWFDARPNAPGWVRRSTSGEDDLAFMIMMDVS
jgi:hypothetical protein